MNPTLSSTGFSAAADKPLMAAGPVSSGAQGESTPRGAAFSEVLANEGSAKANERQGGKALPSDGKNASGEGRGVTSGRDKSAPAGEPSTASTAATSTTSAAGDSESTSPVAAPTQAQGSQSAGDARQPAVAVGADPLEGELASSSIEVDPTTIATGESGDEVPSSAATALLGETRSGKPVFASESAANNAVAKGLNSPAPDGAQQPELAGETTAGNAAGLNTPSAATSTVIPVSDGAQAPDLSIETGAMPSGSAANPATVGGQLASGVTVLEVSGTEVTLPGSAKVPQDSPDVFQANRGATLAAAVNPVNAGVDTAAFDAARSLQANPLAAAIGQQGISGKEDSALILDPRMAAQRATANADGRDSRAAAALRQSVDGAPVARSLPTDLPIADAAAEQRSLMASQRAEAGFDGAMERLLAASEAARGTAERTTGTTMAQTAADPSTAASSMLAASNSTPNGAALTKALPQALQMQYAPNDARFAGEMTAQVRTLVKSGVQEATIQLHPAELGRLQLTISTEGDVARVSMIADSAASRDLIEQSLPRLRDMFEQSGLQLAHSDVSHGGSGESAPESRIAGDNSAADGDGVTGESDAPQITQQASYRLLDTYV